MSACSACALHAGGLIIPGTSMLLKAVYITGAGALQCNHDNYMRAGI